MGWGAVERGARDGGSRTPVPFLKGQTASLQILLLQQTYYIWKSAGELNNVCGLRNPALHGQVGGLWASVQNPVPPELGPGCRQESWSNVGKQNQNSEHVLSTEEATAHTHTPKWRNRAIT